MKDIFKEVGLSAIGIGGMKCPCCNDFRCFGLHGGKRGNSFSKLRRNRVKADTRKELVRFFDGE